MADPTWADVGGTPTAPAPGAAGGQPEATWGDVGGQPIAQSTAAPPSSPSSSLSYTTRVLLGLEPPVSDVDKSVANVRAGLARAPGTFATFPHAIGATADAILGSKEPGWIARNTPDERWVTSLLGGLLGKADEALGYQQQQPLYQAETGPGRVVQDIIAGAPTALVGGGGIAANVARQLANAGGNVLPALGEAAYPDLTPRGKAILALGGALAGGTAPRAGQSTINNAQRAWGGTGIAEKTAAARLMSRADMTRGEMLQTIDDYLNPAATPPSPTAGSLRIAGDYFDLTPAQKQAYIDQVTANAEPAQRPAGLSTKAVLNDPGLNYYDPMAGVRPNPNGTTGAITGLFPALRYGTGGAIAGAIGQALGGAKIPAIGSFVDPVTAGVLGAGTGLLKYGTHRYGDFQRQVGNIAQRMLDDPAIAQLVLGKYSGTDATLPHPFYWRDFPSQVPGLLAPLSTEDYEKR